MSSPKKTIRPQTGDLRSIVGGFCFLQCPYHHSLVTAFVLVAFPPKNCLGFFAYPVLLGVLCQNNDHQKIRQKRKVL